MFRMLEQAQRLDSSWLWPQFRLLVLNHVFLTVIRDLAALVMSSKPVLIEVTLAASKPAILFKFRIIVQSLL